MAACDSGQNPATGFRLDYSMGIAIQKDCVRKEVGAFALFTQRLFYLKKSYLVRIISIINIVFINIVLKQF
jgi:hypothetical protein